MAEPLDREFERLLREVLSRIETSCRYHGVEFFKLGVQWGTRDTPNCDSCKLPYFNLKTVERLQQLTKD
jgi:hypothetical protein